MRSPREQVVRVRLRNASSARTQRAFVAGGYGRDRGRGDATRCSSPEGTRCEGGDCHKSGGLREGSARRGCAQAARSADFSPRPRWGGGAERVRHACPRGGAPPQGCGRRGGGGGTP